MPDELSNRADEIARRIREYTLPAYLVPYNGRDDHLLKEIFARINRRGRALESYEVFQALHASVQGEKGPIDRVRDELTKLGFGAIDPRHIERAAIAVWEKGEPSRPIQDQVPKEEVPALFDRVSSSLALTIEFLANDVGVPHIEFLPYTGVLFTLARFFALHPKPHSRNLELLCRWFWRGTLNENHKASNPTDRPKWRAIDADEHASVQRLLQLIPPVDTKDLPLALSTYRRNTARVDIELLALYALQPRMLVGEEKGQDVSVSSLLGNETPHFPWQVSEAPPGSEKTSALFLLHPNASIEELRSHPPEPELLATHALDSPTFQALLEGNTAEFYARRTEALVRHLRTFLTENAALDPTDRDRPPLDSYFVEESA